MLSDLDKKQMSVDKKNKQCHDEHVSILTKNY